MKGALGRAFDEMKESFGVSRPGGESLRLVERFATLWQTLPTVAEVLSERERGDQPERYGSLYEYALRRWGSRLPDRPLSALCIGCTLDPPVAELLRAAGDFETIVTVDSDAVMLENLAEKGLENVECWQMEPNTDPLPRGPFDVVVCHNALNQLREVDFVLDGIRDVLQARGVLILREYVGPNRLQFTDEQMRMVNAFLALLPEKMKQDASGRVHEYQLAPDLEAMQRLAAGKAIHSELIMPGVLERFKVQEAIPLGGTVLAPLMAGVGEHFQTPSAQAERILRTLLDVERRMIDGGMIGSDYIAAIAWPRP